MLENKLECWNLKINIDLIDYLKKLKDDCKYFLDLNNKNKDKLELFLTKLFEFHIKRLNKDVVTENYLVEFWLEKKVFGMKYFYDKDVYIKTKCYKTPIVCCETYFGDINYCLLATNITMGMYKYKDFPEENNIKLIFPKELNHILLDDNYFNGTIPFEINSNDYYILKMNIWDKFLLNISIYFGTFDE